MKGNVHFWLAGMKRKSARTFKVVIKVGVRFVLKAVSWQCELTAGEKRRVDFFGTTNTWFWCLGVALYKKQVVFFSF